MNRIALLVVLAACGLAAAEEPPITVIPHDWHGFKAGTWVETNATLLGEKVESGTTRMTLGKEKDGLLPVEITHPGQQKGVTCTDQVSDTKLPRKYAEAAGSEDVKVGEKTFTCQVWVSKFDAKDESSGQKFWICKDVAALGGIVRTETWTSGAGARSTRMRLKEVDREVNVCGRTVKAFVLEIVETFDGEKQVSTTEEVHSPEVPGGLVSRSASRKWTDAEGEHTVRSDEAVVAVHLEGGEWAPPPAGK